jgi:hypothetical protein
MKKVSGHRPSMEGGSLLPPFRKLSFDRQRIGFAISLIDYLLQNNPSFPISLNPKSLSLSSYSLFPLLYLPFLPHLIIIINDIPQNSLILISIP